MAVATGVSLAIGFPWRVMITPSRGRSSTSESNRSRTSEIGISRFINKLYNMIKLLYNSSGWTARRPYFRRRPFARGLLVTTVSAFAALFAGA